MQPHIRVSDVDRDRASAILREHYAVGRLNDQELPVRLGAAQSAVTWGDLYALLADLPAIPGMELAPRHPPQGGRPYAQHMAPPVHHPQPYQVPAPPAPPAPGAGYRTAAWVCFGLGFPTFGVTWIPAAIFALLAMSARGSGGDSLISRRPGAFIAAVVAAVSAVLVLFGVGIANTDLPTHTVTMEITSDDPDAAVDEYLAVIDDDETTGTGPAMPFRRTETVEGDVEDLRISARAGEGPDGADPATLTCVIKVDGEVVSTSRSRPATGYRCDAHFDD